jgi:hypothetical protein
MYQWHGISNSINVNIEKAMAKYLSNMASQQ